VNITLDAYPDQTFQGTVSTIGLVAFTSSTGGNAYHARITLPDNSDQKFRVGMGGDVDIIYNTISQTLKVPSSAVITDTTNYVWIIQSGRAKQVQVEVGASSADEVEIKSGLTEGDMVITNPPPTLKVGQHVSS
jgi:HlyD family secretion protein